MKPTPPRAREDSEKPTPGIRFASVRCDNHPDKMAVKYDRPTGARMCKDCL